MLSIEKMRTARKNLQEKIKGIIKKRI